MLLISVRAPWLYLMKGRLSHRHFDIKEERIPSMPAIIFSNFLAGSGTWEQVRCKQVPLLEGEQAYHRSWCYFVNSTLKTRITRLYNMFYIRHLEVLHCIQLIYVMFSVQYNDYIQDRSRRSNILWNESRLNLCIIHVCIIIKILLVQAQWQSNYNRKLNAYEISSGKNTFILWKLLRFLSNDNKMIIKVNFPLKGFIVNGC